LINEFNYSKSLPLPKWILDEMKKEKRIDDRVRDGKKKSEEKRSRKDNSRK
jgi:hypothetical protein